jgi:predicted DNA-binding transcriptional regulator AlpA
MYGGMGMTSYVLSLQDAALMRTAANDNRPLVLTRPEAAEMCSLGVSTFDTWVRKKILPGPIEGTRRWSRRAIERALAGDVVQVALPVSGVEHAATAASPFAEWKRAGVR